jgi:Uma2 family endonuclease
MGTAHAINTGIEMSAEELGRLPRGRARFELVAGELLVMEPGFAEHGNISAEAVRILANHVIEHDLGRAFGAETGFLLTKKPDTVRAPDAAYVSHATIDRAGEVKGYWPGPPDFSVEVVSSGDRPSRVREKALAWVGAGCTLVVVLEPETGTATAFRHAAPPTIHAETETLDCSDAVTGFRPRVEELFPARR